MLKTMTIKILQGAPIKDVRRTGGGGSKNYLKFFGLVPRMQYLISQISEFRHVPSSLDLSIDCTANKINSSLCFYYAFYLHWYYTVYGLKNGSVFDKIL